MRDLIIVIIGLVLVVAMPKIIEWIGQYVGIVPGIIIGVILSLIIMVFLFTKEVE
jgi:hypothetical protein